ncbi:hypothetical protein MtrunA17_Chr7g0232831 [Medicago truncatula]|uniref:Uncharacterized protein n=1 Tax=Medicago truncatula TaxID=3880 RepID=A0A396H367_MEDTR|nr:hypothetical protein MtrunA17_Chr7g0232831 [Medicago truncatula]
MLFFSNSPLTMLVALIISRTSKKQNVSIERGEQSLKSLIIKKTQGHENVTDRKLFQDSKKKASISAENQDGKENKCKPVINSKKCFCSPTTQLKVHSGADFTSLVQQRYQQLLNFDHYLSWNLLKKFAIWNFLVVETLFF